MVLAGQRGGIFVTGATGLEVTPEIARRLADRHRWAEMRIRLWCA